MDPLKKLKKDLENTAAQLIDKMEHASADIATMYLAQSRAAISISKSPQKLKKLWKEMNDADEKAAVITGADKRPEKSSGRVKDES